jgi:hypothetical protein
MVQGCLRARVQKSAYGTKHRPSRGGLRHQLGATGGDITGITNFEFTNRIGIVWVSARNAGITGVPARTRPALRYLRQAIGL